MNSDATGDNLVEGSHALHYRAAGLAIGASFIHALAGEGHFSEWWGYGVFFLAVAICQLLGGAGILFMSDRRLYWTGIIGTVFVLIMWTISRTVGIHIGPDSAAPESIGVLDAVANVVELALIWQLALLLRHPSPAPLEGGFNDD